MKYILNNPTEEQINALKKLGLCVYRTSEGIHYVDLPEITEEELPKVDVVDLGLPSGLKWASCNIGASSPCESGLLFQFGRIDGYTYNDTSHQFRTKEQNIADTGYEYIPKTTSGTIYNAGEVLGTADDAVYVATNGKLRMPTIEEINELLSGTTNQWCQCNVLNGEHTSHSVFGCLFTSKTNADAKIFIPAAGFFSGDDDIFSDAGYTGTIWSSSVRSDGAGDAYLLYLASDYCGNNESITRFYGFSVRGVCTNTHYVPNVPEISKEELPEGAVDLGLPSGLKWASCNIGANSPCESGLLFQFGRVDGYEYNDPLHQFRTPEQNTEDTGYSDIPATTSGKVYNTGDVLGTTDDAAYVATNGKMRMPTAKEIDELLVNTTNEWCQCTVLGEDNTSHTVKGRLFTSKADTSKKIFIPASGFFSGDDGSFYGACSGGSVWSSTVSITLRFDPVGCYSNGIRRNIGYPVRGVCK